MDVKRKLFSVVQSFLSKRGFYLTYAQTNIGRERIISLIEKPDYIRFGAFELVADEINKNGVQGNVCELGVYKGEFSKYINTAFKDRTLYLFDTFEGFNCNDYRKDNELNYVEGKDQLFKDTSIDLVLSKMSFPDRCIVKKGYFPETALGLEDEKFAFVSLDADLYDPLYAGLNFFYPRLSKGGYIFVHDYNNKDYKGAKSAVRKFCNENDVRYFPLCDSHGTAIISK